MVRAGASAVDVWSYLTRRLTHTALTYVNAALLQAGTAVVPRGFWTVQLGANVQLEVLMAGAVWRAFGAAGVGYTVFSDGTSIRVRELNVGASEWSRIGGEVSIPV